MDILKRFGPSRRTLGTNKRKGNRQGFVPKLQRSRKAGNLGELLQNGKQRQTSCVKKKVHSSRMWIELDSRANSNPMELGKENGVEERGFPVLRTHHSIYDLRNQTVYRAVEA
ncbi:hypothetical protein Trydic_g9832 [Trypoxylus dichotomus]